MSFALLLLLAASQEGAELGEVRVRPRRSESGGGGTEEGPGAPRVRAPVAFADDELRDPASLHILRDGESVDFLYRVTSRWPNSWVRTMVLLVDLQPGEEEITLRLESRRRRNRGAREARSEDLEGDLGPVATPAGARLARSGIFGPLVHESESERSRTLASRAASAVRGLRAPDHPPPDQTARLFWTGDPIRAAYQIFVITGDEEVYRKAHELAVRYRTTQVIWEGVDRGCVEVARTYLRDGTPATSPLMSVIVQGLLDDYLLTGDEASMRAGLLVADAIAQAVPIHLQTRPDTYGGVHGWFAIQLLAAYRVTGDRQYLQAAQPVIQALVQSFDDSNAWPLEYSTEAQAWGCPRAIRGGMTYWACCGMEALVEYARLEDDRAARDAAVRAAQWLVRSMSDDGSRVLLLPACRACTTHGPDMGVTDATVPLIAFAARETGRADLRSAAESLLDAVIRQPGYDASTAYRWCAQAIGYLESEP